MFTVDILTATVLAVLVVKSIISTYRNFRDRGLLLIDDEDSYYQGA
jgi:hypothetical protein